MSRTCVALLFAASCTVSLPAQLLHSPWTDPGANLDLLATGDIDLDGYPDVVGHEFAVGIVAYLSNNGIAGNIPTVLVPSYLPGTPPIQLGQLLVADFTGDGFDDILVQANVGGAPPPTWTLFENDPTGGLIGPLPSIPSTTAGSTSTAVGDVNGDGTADLARIVTSFGSSLAVFTSGSTFWVPVYASTVSQPGAEVLVGDFDGDGIDEVCLVQTGNGGATLTYHDGFEAGTPNVTTLGGYPTSVNEIVHDMDGDGCDDIVLTGFASSVTAGYPVTVVRGDTTTPLSTQVASTITLPRLAAAAIGCADFDGDGYGDVAYIDGAFNGLPTTLYVARGQGTGFWSQAVLDYQAPGVLLTLSTVVDDFDQDGDPDVFLSNQAHRRYLRNLARDFNSCAGSTGVPDFQIGSAYPGNAGFALVLTGALPNAPAAIAVSTGAGPGGACGLAVELGGLLLPAGPVGLAQTDVAGDAAVVVPIPVSLSGSTLHAQWGVVDPVGGVSVAGTAFATSVKRTIHVY